MAEDAETPEQMDAEEIESASVETHEPEGKKKKREFKLKNPLGFIFNIRMLRRVVQIFFLLVLNAYIFGAWWGQEAITQFWVDVRAYLPTLPIIAPLEAPFAIIAGSFDIMQRELTGGLFPFFTLGAMIIILTILGRAACGWVCPIGTIQDFATLPSRSKIRPAPGTEKELRRVKGYIGVIVLFFVAWIGISVTLGTADALIEAMGMFANAPFDPFNPAYIVFVKIPEMIESEYWPKSIETLWRLGYWTPIFWLQISFVFLVAIVSFWFPRWFCRWICPAGWFYGLFSRDALVGIGRNPARCTPDVCNVCEVVCPMNIRIRRFPYQHVYSPDCIMCLECKSHCPNNAIEIAFL